MQYWCLVDFRHDISVFANFSCGNTVLGTPQCPPPYAVTRNFDAIIRVSHYLRRNPGLKRARPQWCGASDIEDITCPLCGYEFYLRVFNEKTKFISTSGHVIVKYDFRTKLLEPKFNCHFIRSILKSHNFLC